ncbi:MAG: hypothetical protein HXX13_05550 [Bacteroidetes bacterium]|nr:hypothetical protein [Bacteroidota bacterium]
MKRRNKISSFFSIGIFFILLFSAFLQKQFHFLAEIPNKENRRLSELPAFNLNYLDPFPLAYESYYNDQFAFRNQIIKLYADINLNLFKISPFPDQVIIGKRGHLFLVPNELANYQRTNLLSQSDLDKLRSDFIHRKKYFEQKGIDYYVAVAPSKYTIYPEFLPGEVMKLDTVCRADQFIGVLKSIGIQVIDLRTSLRAAKDTVPGLLFLKTDNHWNELGAFIAYQDIMNQISRKHPGLPVLRSRDFEIKEETCKGGDIASILNWQQNDIDVHYTFTPRYTIRTTEITPCPYPIPKDIGDGHYYSGYYIENSTLPKFLMIHDSFGRIILPYFRDSFSRTAFVWDHWQYKINENLVEGEKPAVYVILCFEGLLNSVVNNCEIKK